MCRSRLRMKSRLMPSRSARALMQVSAAWADSCITSPSLPVSVTAPRPLTRVASICSTSPPTSVHARPVARPISLSAATPCWRNLIGPSICCTRSAPIKSLIIRHYTRESGVRNLEREIGSCCRKIARKFVGENVAADFKDLIGAERVQQMLVPIKFRQQGVAAESEIGLATGLAWTEVGGEVLQIEATLVKGRGAVTLTGKLGDVMQESAQAALTCIKARAERLSINLDFIRKRDLHIHIPEGAIPKDGPSAGITMAAAMASALMRQPIRKNVAMTGEITLRGRILPIGGVKEKLLAAHRFGIDTIILPKDNEKDLPEVPEEVRSVLDINLVETIDEVIALALEETTAAPIADDAKALPLWTTEPPPGLQAPVEQ